MVDDSAQGYKVESNGNEAPCKESSCEDCPLLLPNPEEPPETPYRMWEDTKRHLGFNTRPVEGSGLFMTRLSPLQGCQGLSCHNPQEHTYPACNVLLKTVCLAPVIDIM